MFTKLLNLLKATWSFSKFVRSKILIFIALFVFVYALDLLAPFCIGYMLKTVAEKGLTSESMKDVVLLLGAFMAIRLTVVSGHHLARVIQLRAAFSTYFESVRNFLQACLIFPLRWHLKRHSGENLRRIHRSAAAIDAVLANYIWQIIDGIVKVIFALSALSVLSPKVGFIVLVTSFVSLNFMLFFNKQILICIKAMNFFWEKVDKLLVDTLNNIVTVKMLNLESPLIARVVKARDGGISIYKKLSKFMELKWGSIGIGFVFMTALSIFVYLYDLKNSGKAVDIALIYVLMDYLNRINQAISSFTGYYSGLLESATNFEEGFEMYSESKAFEKQSNLSANNILAGNLFIKQLSFRYTLTDMTGIDCGNLLICEGEKIAIVGPSGSGKSTFLKCLAGMLEPQVEEVYLHNQPIKLAQFSKNTLLLPQEPELFSDTILFNLVFNEEVPPYLIEKALSLAQIDDLIKRLPQGLLTDLSHHGLSVSVGEKQRLALARGFIKAHKVDFLLLDEPTSSVDPITEREIFKRMLSYFASKTILCVVHRLGVVNYFDKIAVVEGGELVEYGSFQDLIELKGTFFNLWQDFANLSTDRPILV